MSFSANQKEEEIQKAYDYCESVTKLHAKSFYFAAKFLPKIKQKAVYPIYAFCRHVDDEIDEIGEGNEQKAIETVEKWEANLNFVYSLIGEEEKRRRGESESEDQSSKIKIQSSKIENQFSEIENQKSKIKNQKSVFLAWSDLLQTYKIPQDLPLDLINGVLMDTHIKRYKTFEELYVYCYRVASTVGLMSSEILGYSEKIALKHAEEMGIGMQLTNILRDIKEDAERGRIYLPKEDLQKFGVSEEQIFANKFDENFRELMKFQIERARNYYKSGEKGISMLEKDSRFTVLLASRIYSKILDEIEKLDYNIFLKRAHTTKSQKFLAIPKIWRESKKM